MWQPRIRRGAASKFMGIVEAIEEDVAAGLIGAGDRMPAQRGVAAALALDLTTVTRAYAEAKVRGILEASAGRGGTRVAPNAPQAAARALGQSIDLSLNIPPQPAQAELVHRLGRAVADTLTGGAGVLQYGFPGGSEADRIAGAGWLAPVLGPSPPDRIVVASGAQAALFGTFAAVLKTGDGIAMPAATFPGAIAAARQLGIGIVPLTMDAEGILPDALELACAAGKGVKAVYVVPTLDNPTTGTLSQVRRQALVAVAARHDLKIIEDDPYRRLMDSAPAAIAALAPERTFHIATLSKCATPGLRIAYVATPSAALAQQVADVLRSTTLMAPPLMAAVASRWISDGTLARVTRAVREESQARLQLAAQVLPDGTYRSQAGGHHIWLAVPQNRSAAAFATGDDLGRAVRVSLGAASDRTVLRIGLKRLADMMRAEPDRPALV